MAKFQSEHTEINVFIVLQLKRSLLRWRQMKL